MMRRPVSFTFDGCALTERCYAPSSRVTSHSHPAPAIGIMLEGALTHVAAHQSHLCRPFTVVIKPAGESHHNDVHAAGGRGLFVELHPHTVSSLGRFASALGRSAHFDGGLIGALASRVDRELRLMDDVTPLALEGLVLDLVAEVARSTARGLCESPGWLNRVHQRIRDEFTRVPLLSALAADAGVSPGHLARTFRRHYGMSVGQFVRSVRLEYTAGQLRHGTRAVADIAAEAGFCDQSHLTRAFQRYTGDTPGVFRSRGHGHTKPIGTSKRSFPHS